MKNNISIAKSGFRKLIDAAAKKYRFFAPVEEDGNVLFRDVSEGGEITFDYLNTTTNPKDFFLPRFETLFRYNKDEIEPVLPDEKSFVVFGIRPCDVQGMTVLDKVFLDEDYPDGYYRDRREKATIVTLACNRPDPTCFCGAVGGGPAMEEGSDVMAYDLGERIIMKPVSRRGEDFIRAVSGSGKKATVAEMKEAEKKTAAAAEKMKTEIDLPAVKKSLDSNFENEFWTEVHQKCVGCGICTYLCPTCYCFDLTDESRGEKGKRLRSWDSCMFPLFTLHASGHNPRPSGKERLRQRIMHKFKYLPDNFQITGCTGCGRCVRECPVNLDIREVLTSVAVIGSPSNNDGTL